MFETVIYILILFVLDYSLSAIGKHFKFSNWRGIFKSIIPGQCDITPEGSTHTGRRQRRVRRCRRSRRGQVNVARSDAGLTISLQEDTPHEDGVVHTTCRSADSSGRPTDANIDCSLSEKCPSNIKESQLLVQEKHQSEPETHSHGKLRAEESSGQDGEAGKEILAQDGETHKSKHKAKDGIMAQDKKKAKGSKNKGWKKDVASPWAEWKKATDCKRVVEKAKRKTFRYPYQVDTSKTGATSPDDSYVDREKTAVPTLQEEEAALAQSDKNESTSEQTPEVSSSDIKTPEESDGDKTASDSTDKTAKSEDEIPPDVLRISMVETIYESRSVITGKSIKPDRKVTSPKSFERRRPFRTRASTRTPTASSFRQKRKTSEWQVAVIHKKTLGHKGNNFQRPEPPSETSSSEATVPEKTVLSSRLDTTTVGGGQLKKWNTKEQGPFPETTTHNTGVKEVSGKDGMDVCKSPQTDPSKNTKAGNGAPQPSDQTTVNNTASAHRSTTSTSSLVSDSDLTEKRNLAKIGRRKRARARKQLAQAAASAALKFTEQIETTLDGEIITRRDYECPISEGEMDTPLAIKAVMICPPKISHAIPEWAQRYLPKNSYLGL